MTNPPKNQDKDFLQYHSGLKNRLVRHYFYIQRGLALLNEFRYLIMGVLGVYYALRIDNFWLIPAMFILSIPILIVIGWISVYHMAKTIDYLNIQHSTHWSRYQYTLLEEILKAITRRKANEKIHNKDTSSNIKMLDKNNIQSCDSKKDSKTE